jgi:hypothetical protein
MHVQYQYVACSNPIVFSKKSFSLASLPRAPHNMSAWILIVSRARVPN